MTSSEICLAFALRTNSKLANGRCRKRETSNEMLLRKSLLICACGSELIWIEYISACQCFSRRRILQYLMLRNSTAWRDGTAAMI